MTDAQLIKKFLMGEVSAFNTLVWRWQLPLYNFILRFINDREEARDLCQTAFIKVFHHLKHLKDPEKFSSWIYQVAANVCRDELKKKKRRKTYAQDDVSIASAAAQDPDGLFSANLPPAPPDRAIEKQNISELLHRALQTLPPEQRIVVIMKEYQGLKFNEIAEALQLSENTVKSRMYYGLKNLKKIFDHWNIDREQLIYEL